MISDESPTSPLAALVAMAFIAGVVGSLWWNTREGADPTPAATSTAQAASGGAAGALRSSPGKP